MIALAWWGIAAHADEPSPVQEPAQDAAPAQDAVPAPTQGADPCAGADGGLPVGPASAGLWDGELGLARPVCARTELEIAPRGLLLVDTPAFYGRISAAVALEGTVKAGDTALWLRLEPARYESVISAISSSFLGYGYTSVGLSQRLDDGAPVAVAFASELVLPTAIGLSGHSYPFGLDLAFAAEGASGPWSGHGQLGYVWSAAATRGPSQLRSGYAGTVGGAWRPGRAFSLVLDLQTAVAYTAVLDHLAAAPAVRVGAGNTLGFELAGVVPLLGRERALAAVELRTSIRR